MKKTILIAGGTGLIGQKMASMLKKQNYEVTLLSRSKNVDLPFQVYQWNVRKQQIDEKAIKNADVIVNLAGAGIADKRWTDKRKKEIVNSRLNSTQLLFEAVKKYRPEPEAYVSASAIGYYGAINSDTIFTEKHPPAADFLGQTCQKWEEAATQFETLGIRTVKIRIGVVLAKNGGALNKMLTTSKLGLGAPLGSGRQYFPWIHITDLCRIFARAIADEAWQGSYNAVAPQHITNKTFSKTLSKILGKPFFAPNVPAFVLKAMFGEMADTILKGSRVSAKKVQEAGFQFEYPKIEQALRSLKL